MQASLSDGRQALFGCVNVTQTQAGSGGCNDTNIRQADFEFLPGETVTNLTLWAGYNTAMEPNQRAGAMNMVTSMVSCKASVLAGNATVAHASLPIVSAISRCANYEGTDIGQRHKWTRPLRSRTV